MGVNMDKFEKLRNPFFSNIDYNKALELTNKGVALKREGKIEAALEALLEAHSYFPDVDSLQAIAKSLYICGEYRLGLDYYLWSWLADFSFRLEKYKSTNITVDELFVHLSNNFEQGINILRHIGYFIATLSINEKILTQQILKGNNCWSIEFNGPIDMSLLLSNDCLRRYKGSISGKREEVSDDEDREAIKLALSVLLSICRQSIDYSLFIDKTFKPLATIIVPTEPIHIANITNIVLPKLGLQR